MPICMFLSVKVLSTALRDQLFFVGLGAMGLLKVQNFRLIALAISIVGHEMNIGQRRKGLKFRV